MPYGSPSGSSLSFATGWKSVAPMLPHPSPLPGGEGTVRHPRWLSPAALRALGAFQKSENGFHALVDRFAAVEAERLKDAAHVVLDGLLGGHQFLGDAGVRVAFRHQREHLALAIAK